MRGVRRSNGLSITLPVLFVATIWGQALGGHRAENEERRDHGQLRGSAQSKPVHAPHRETGK